jgi:outer membrane receptor for ferrienterochelin and colicins
VQRSLWLAWQSSCWRPAPASVSKASMDRAPGTAFLGIIASVLVICPVSAQVPVSSEEHDEEETEEIVVHATRSGRRVQDEPIRVEVLNREEIEEKLLMRPGSIAMLVNETGGVRVQVTSPALGAANIRIQGMSGRYTQLLADGLPLYGGQTSSLGLLQIPPTDLGQVEVIKGAASALYGPSALGGVINLVSRRPHSELERELLLNVTSRDGQDITGFVSSPIGAGWSYSFSGGVHRQDEEDLDEDAWLDIPGYERWTARPRLFWEGDEGASVYLTFGAMREEREGGTAPARTLADGQIFPQTQNTDRYDGGIVAEVPREGLGMVHLRASGMLQDHQHRFGEVFEDDRHGTMFVEASLTNRLDRTSWTAGLAFQSDDYRSDAFPVFDHDYRVPGLFAQVEHDVGTELTLAASGRVDHHSEYGTEFSPRLSALYRPGAWTLRASLGRGFYAPTPFVEEIESVGLSRLEPLSGLNAETAETASFDVGYTFGAWETSATFFASDLSDTTRLQRFVAADGSSERVRLINVDGPTRIRGSELLLRYRKDSFTVTGSYVLTDATEPARSGSGRDDVPLTPRHTAGIVAMWEEHGRGRVGIEAYYTGKQRLEDNPYRHQSRSYVELGLLGEIVLGKVRLFVNAENLLDVRQTDYDPLLLPQRAADGRYTVDVWAPTDGFVVNGGIRVQF